MELVRGIRITEYCDQNNLSTRERLDLFTKVVQAVQHAHQKGIIHRDIKPSNVLITLHDGVPVPKVIDFGIAKALEQKLTDKTLFTQFEQFIGTPAYTSPEQAEMSGLDIDTRSDIYSLGVLLYELLVGKTPFDAEDLVHSGLDEMRRIIREKEPVRPSTRLSTMVQGEITTTAQRRRVSAPELIHLLKGDLDWVVMKCLEKDRTRRYETASGLAGDIQHYLSNEPVSACPPSKLYRFGKLVRRNKLAFAAGAAVGMALVIGIVVSTWQAARARRAEQAAKAEKDSAQAVLNFFRDNVLAAGRPEGQKGGLGINVTLRQAVDAAESQIAESFKGQPLVEAAIRKTLGETYRELGEPALAIRQLERALALRRQGLGLEHEGTIATMDLLAGAYLHAGKPNEALPLFEEILKLRRAALEPEHASTLGSMNSLALAYNEAGKHDQALPLYEETLKLKRAKLGPDHPDTLVTMNNLALAYERAGKLDQALPLLEETLKLWRAKLGPEHPRTFMTMNNLAQMYTYAGKPDQALPLLQEALKPSKARLGPDHPDTLTIINNLALAYDRAGKLDQALPLYEETLNRTKARLGPEHPDTLGSTLNLAQAYVVARRRDQLPFLEETFKLLKTRLGPDHRETLNTMNNLAAAYEGARKLDQAEALYRERLDQKKDSLTATLALARVLLERAKADTENPVRARERAAEGEQLLRDYLANVRARYTNDTAKLENSLAEVAELHYRHGNYAAAEPLYREHVQSERSRLPPDRTLSKINSLGRLLADWAWAERNGVGRAVPSTPGQVADTGGAVGTPRPTSVIADRAREAEQLLRECLTTRLRNTNAIPRHIADDKSRLGAALLSVAVTDIELNAPAREAKLAEAETLLLEGGQRLQESNAADKYKRDALERLMRLYQAWGKPEKLSEWQQKLAAFDKAKTESSASAEQDRR